MELHAHFYACRGAALHQCCCDAEADAVADVGADADTVDLSSAGLAKTPNPVGNAPIGDLTGRDTVAYVGSNLNESTLIDRMHKPSEGYLDRAISPVTHQKQTFLSGGGPEVQGWPSYQQVC